MSIENTSFKKESSFIKNPKILSIDIKIIKSLSQKKNFDYKKNVGSEIKLDTSKNIKFKITNIFKVGTSETDSETDYVIITKGFIYKSDQKIYFFPIVNENIFSTIWSKIFKKDISHFNDIIANIEKAEKENIKKANIENFQLNGCKDMKSCINKPFCNDIITELMKDIKYDTNYKKLSLKYHPDKNKKNDAVENFQCLNQVNEELKKLIK